MNASIQSGGANAVRTPEWHESLLEGILPGECETALLRACLVGAASHSIARNAWRDFIACVREPKHYFESANGGLKGLLPFVEDCLQRNGIDVPAAFLTYARVATVREELRDRIYRTVFREALQMLQDAGVHPLVLRGLPLAVACYPTPRRRHNHGIEMLVDAHEIESAIHVLLDMGCRYGVQSAGSPNHIRLVHSSGLPLVLHTRLFELPHLTAPLQAIRARATEIEIDRQLVSVPCTEDQLLHVCGHACYSSSRGNLRWVCDAVQLIQLHHDSIDWPRFVATAGQSLLALPMAVLLQYLRQMTSDVPERVIAALRTHHRLSETVAREAIYAMCLEPPTRSVPPGPRTDFGSWLSFTRFRLLPSRQFVAWKHGATGAWMIACYLRRPFRFVARRGARLLQATRRTNPISAEQTLS